MLLLEIHIAMPHSLQVCFTLSLIETEKPESGQWKFGLVDRIHIQWNQTIDGFVLEVCQFGILHFNSNSSQMEVQLHLKLAHLSFFSDFFLCFYTVEFDCASKDISSDLNFNRFCFLSFL